jgi:hypothetical protein
VLQLHCKCSESLFYGYKCICESRFSVEAELELGFLRTVKSEMFVHIYSSLPIVNFKNSRRISSNVCTDGYRSLTSLFLLSFLFWGHKYEYLVFAHFVADVITKNYKADMDLHIQDPYDLQLTCNEKQATSSLAVRV